MSADSLTRIAELEQALAAATAQAEQRTAELAVINTVQQGLAAELGFQAIVDLVGDKLREVFDSDDLGIRIFDLKAGTVDMIYSYEHGVRLPQPLPAKFRPDGATQRLIELRQPI